MLCQSDCCQIGAGFKLSGPMGQTNLRLPATQFYFDSSRSGGPTKLSSIRPLGDQPGAASFVVTTRFPANSIIAPPLPKLRIPHRTFRAESPGQATVGNSDVAPAGRPGQRRVLRLRIRPDPDAAALVVLAAVFTVPETWLAMRKKRPNRLGGPVGHEATKRMPSSPEMF